MNGTDSLVIVGFLSGTLALGYWTAGLFFFRFWKQTQDRLFRNFAWALWALSAERVVMLFIGQMNEIRPFIYLIRFSAFLLILIAIIQKNRGVPA